MKRNFRIIMEKYTGLDFHIICLRFFLSFDKIINHFYNTLILTLNDIMKKLHFFFLLII